MKACQKDVSTKQIKIINYYFKMNIIFKNDRKQKKKRKIDLEKLRNEVIELNNNKNQVEEVISQIKAKLEKVQEQVNATDNT